MGFVLTMRLHARPDGPDEKKECRIDDADNEHAAKTPLKLLGAISIPGNAVTSTDIAWVDPGTERYYLADRSNDGVDIIDAETNLWLARVGGMQGHPTTPMNGSAASNSSGPNGVTVTNTRRLWAGDGNTTLDVADVDPDSPTFGQILAKIDVADHDPTSPSFCDDLTNPTSGHWCSRADELAYDPVDKLVVIGTPGPFSPKVSPTCNHCPVAPYATVVSAVPPYKILARFHFVGAGGFEQPAWDSSLQRMWMTVPGSLTTGMPPRIYRLNPKTLTLDKTISLNCTALGNAASASTTGLAVAPYHHLLASACGFPVDVNAITGTAKTITKQVGGGDEVWYNSGDGRFYVTGADATTNVSNLGVMNAATDTLLQELPVATGAPPPPGSTVGVTTRGRNPAAFSENNHVFVQTPVTAAIAAGTHADDSLCAVQGIVGHGCVLVFGHVGEVGDDEDQ
jgi:hypothetical protein